MTLFSGTFFPVDRLPAWVQPIAWVSPLWHGTELARARRARRRGGAARARARRPTWWRCWRSARRWPPRASGGGCTGERARSRLRAVRGRRRCRVLPGCCRPAATPAGRGRWCCGRPRRPGGPGWRSCPGFFEPVFYLVAMGQGLGSLVGTLPGPDGTPISYAAFIAPGLLAASAMNGAVFDSTFNVFFKLKYTRLYDAMLATPLGPVDIALGEIGWALMRGGLYAAGVPRGDGRLRAARLAVGAAGAAGRAGGGVRASPPSAWRPPPTCAPGRTSTWSRWRSCRCSCSPPRSTRCRSTRGGCRSWWSACRCTTPSS